MRPAPAVGPAGQPADALPCVVGGFPGRYVLFDFSSARCGATANIENPPPCLVKTAVLLSGGVDSSVALRLLVEEGKHDLRACYLKVWLEDDAVLAGDCPWEEDVRYVRAVCEQLGVPLEIVPLQAEYLEHVVDHALGELRAGRTPSPDILCNQRIKFGAFLERVGDCDAVASGHYARLGRENGRAVLLRAADPVKDQTYFLSNLGQQQLQRLLFPVGHLRKQEVRELAARFDLPTRDRKDSQGICFLGKIDYREFVAGRLGKREGAIIEKGSGRELGRHRGYWFYTIGQRFGLGLGGRPVVRRRQRPRAQRRVRRPPRRRRHPAAPAVPRRGPQLDLGTARAHRPGVQAAPRPRHDRLPHRSGGRPGGRDPGASRPGDRQRPARRVLRRRALPRRRGHHLKES